MITLKDKTWISIGTELFYVLVMVLVCLKLSYAIPDAMDVLFHDESIYLNRGNTFNSSCLFTDGFIYFAWYKLLSFFVTDTITLYYFNLTYYLLREEKA